MPSMIDLTINGRSVTCVEGMTILSAARMANITIPTLCYLAGVNEIGMCRMCVVEVEGRQELVAACNTPAEDGMVIRTMSERVAEARKMALSLLLSKHGLDSTDYCFSCAKNGACELQALCREYEVTQSPFAQKAPRKPVRDSNPFLRFDPNLCIKCQRCVSTCNKQARNHTLTTGKKGVITTIMAPFGPNWNATDCESCGNCAQACPTGAITEKRRKNYREWEVTHTVTTCPHCAVGCQLDMMTKDGRIVDVEAANGPSNRGMLCVKGRSASFDFVTSPERLTTPLVRNQQTGELEPADWDVALDLVARRFGQLKEQHGGDSLAAFACSRSTNEDVYLLQKMARTAFGTNNVDNCARV